MNLYINSPTYYKTIYGIDDEIYKFCWDISCKIDISRYTNVIDSIAITPIIAPIEILQKKQLKEKKYVSTIYRFSDIQLTIDFDEYTKGNIYVKKKLILNNIISSIKIVKKKLKNNFDYNLFEKDIINLLQICDNRLVL